MFAPIVPADFHRESLSAQPIAEGKQQKEHDYQHHNMLRTGRGAAAGHKPDGATPGIDLLMAKAPWPTDRKGLHGAVDLCLPPPNCWRGASWRGIFFSS